MTLVESTPVAYGYSTATWPAASRGASVSGFAVTFGEWAPRRASWLRAAAERLKDLFLLESGWDGGVAPQLSPPVIQVAWELLRQVCDLMPAVQMPLILPTANGGVALEWTAEAGDLTIELDGTPRLSFDIPAHGAPWEGSFNDSPVNAGELLFEYFT